MRLFFIFVISLLIAVPSYVSGEEFTNNVVKLSDSLVNGAPLKIEVRKLKIPSRYPYAHAFMWGGDEVKMPKTVITAIEIFSGTEKIYVPLSAYGDLGDPSQVSLERTRKGFQIMIQGGDAAGSYKAVLVFNNENIERRKVTHGEFSNEVWEETTYSFISKTDKR